jgi:prepilin-type N-terminal cleavage/methylation domain-containing protein
MKTVKQSFTLVEILVVIVIIGILSSFIFFTINDSVDKANIAKSKMFSESIKNNLLLNLVSEWKFDDSTNLGLDSWGSNNGTNNGATAITDESQCVSDGCASFNTNDYIRISDSDSFNFGSKMSMFTWVKGEGQNSNYIFSKYDDGTGVDQRSFAITVYNTDGFRVMISDNGSWTTGHIKNYYTTQKAFDNFWHLIGFSFNEGELTLYLDSYECNISKILDDDISSIYNSSSDAGVGIKFQTNSPVAFLTGLIDNIQVYNTVLPESQIKQNYLLGLNNLYAKGLITELEYNEKLSEL